VPGAADFGARHSPSPARVRLSALHEFGHAVDFDGLDRPAAKAGHRPWHLCPQVRRQQPARFMTNDPLLELYVAHCSRRRAVTPRSENL
jgi:hypothetical protein